MPLTTTPTAGGKARRADASSLFLRSIYVVGAAAFGAELLMAAVPAAVAGPDPSRVHIGDLDLNSDVDVAVLDQRIATAARAACRAPDRISDPLIGYRRCIADTTATARARLDQAVRKSRSDLIRTPASRTTAAQ